MQVILDRDRTKSLEIIHSQATLLNDSSKLQGNEVLKKKCFFYNIVSQAHFRSEGTARKGCRLGYRISDGNAQRRRHRNWRLSGPEWKAFATE